MSTAHNKKKALGEVDTHRKERQRKATHILTSLCTWLLEQGFEEIVKKNKLTKNSQEQLVVESYDQRGREGRWHIE